MNLPFWFIIRVFTAMTFIMPLKLQMAGESLACVRDVYSSNALDLRISIAVKLRKVSLVSSLSISDKVRKEVRINMTIGDKLKMWEWQIHLVTLGRAAYAICYWHLNLYSQGTDVMMQSLNMDLSYTFSPFSMILRGILNIKQGCVPFLTLTAPVWSTQPW